jgi:hypothetical protein
LRGLRDDGRRVVRLDVLRLELGNRRVGFRALLERLAVPVVLVLEQLDALALERARHNHRRPAGRLAGLLERGQHLRHVLAVDADHVPAERFPSRDERVRVVRELRRTALTEPVDVGNGAQVVELVERRHLRGFPDRTLRDSPSPIST